VHPLSLVFNESYFFEATSFHPERWLPQAIENHESPFYNDKRNAVQPFSIGPRSCIGRPLALAESRLTLARLIWAFDMDEADTQAGRLVWEQQRSFTVVEKQPFEVRLVPRR
jgi:cytochrome P450